MTFAHPEILLLLLLVPAIIGFELWRSGRSRAGVQFSSTAGIRGLPRSIWMKLRNLPLFLRSSVVILGILALARPQVENVTREIVAEGVDIMLILDLSSSMKAEDLKPNRFEAARNVARDFIDSRISDRVGLVLFAGRAYLQVPPTLDYAFLKQMIDEIDLGMVEDGTAIGMGLAAAVNRLKDSEAESKVAILLTDGENNRGEIDPLTAADIAAALGVRVYTVGVSSMEETAPYPVAHPFFGRRMAQIPVDIDERMMELVAERTGGRYFRAWDNASLHQTYNEISELEKTRLEDIEYRDRDERYLWFLLPALILLVLELVLSSTRLQRVP